MSFVDVDFRKWPDHPHWRFQARRLGSDAFGDWLATAPPTTYSGPRGVGVWEYGFVVLVPHNDWWAAAFGFPQYDVYVDVGMPARWLGPSHVVVVDLDLDVVRLNDGRVELLDADEFAEHRDRFEYPADVAERALQTADRLMRAVEMRREPFGRAGLDWLERTRFSAGRALRRR